MKTRILVFFFFFFGGFWYHRIFATFDFFLIAWTPTAIHQNDRAVILQYLVIRQTNKLLLRTRSKPTTTWKPASPLYMRGPTCISVSLRKRPLSWTRRYSKSRQSSVISSSLQRNPNNELCVAKQSESAPIGTQTHQHSRKSQRRRKFNHGCVGSLCQLFNQSDQKQKKKKNIHNARWRLEQALVSLFFPSFPIDLPSAQTKRDNGKSSQEILKLLLLNKQTTTTLNLF